MTNDIRNTKVKSTAVMTDIRNFSGTFKDFQNMDSDAFLGFIREYYNAMSDIAGIISDETWLHSIGDGIMTIFLDDENHKTGFAYTIVAHHIIKKMCEDFVNDNPGTILSFGIGADQGNVWKIDAGYLTTYVGTVINRASRIEASTKLFAHATTAVGNSLYKKLLKDFYPSSYDIMKGYNSYDAILNKHPEAVLISKQFMLQYVFDMPLKGIQKDAPIFRLSDSLASDKVKFWDVLEKLLPIEKVNKLHNYINNL